MAGKYTKAKKAIQEKQAFEKEQKQLHEKYEEEPEHVVIKEKSNMVKFTVKTFRAVLRTVVTILLVCLAAVGILTLLYPEVRYEFLLVLEEIFKGIQEMFRQS